MVNLSSRFTTCVTLQLPPRLGCWRCKSQLEKLEHGKVKKTACTKNRCERPFHWVFEYNRCKSVRLQYNEIHKYLVTKYNIVNDELLDYKDNTTTTISSPSIPPFSLDDGCRNENKGKRADIE